MTTSDVHRNPARRRAEAAGVPEKLPTRAPARAGAGAEAPDKHRVAIVTGGVRGLGLACVLATST